MIVHPISDSAYTTRLVACGVVGKLELGHPRAHI